MDAAVDRNGLERELARVREAAAGPSAGVFGPGSMLWRVDREAALFLGAGRALLLQLAHPWVAAAIAEHSPVLQDPFGRFHRTFETTFALVFGDLDQALATARRLHRRHGAVQGRLPPGEAGSFAPGSPYRANEVAAMRWVWATLADTALLAHDLLLPPLGEAEREAYYGENRRLAALFGLPPDALPPDWASFTAYTEDMLASGVLAVTPAARAIAGQLLWTKVGPVRVPGWYRALTAELLPPRLRDGFGLGGTDGRRAARAVAWLRRAYPALPRRLRHVGPYQEAEARLRGTGPDLVARTLNRFWIGRPSMPR